MAVLFKKKTDNKVFNRVIYQINTNLINLLNIIVIYLPCGGRCINIITPRQFKIVRLSQPRDVLLLRIIRIGNQFMIIAKLSSNYIVLMVINLITNKPHKAQKLTLPQTHHQHHSVAFCLCVVHYSPVGIQSGYYTVSSRFIARNRRNIIYRILQT